MNHAHDSQSSKFHDLTEQAQPVPALVERLLADQRQHWQRGERMPVEGYLLQHPGLHDAETILQLILNEVILRELEGETPQLQEYQRRFPQLAEQLELQFAMDHALQADLLSQATTKRQSLVSVPDERPLGAANRPTVPGYDLLAKLGQGGMGIVYKAFDKSRKEIVALKTLPLLDAESLHRFRREFRSLEEVTHPNLVHLYHLGVDGSTWFFTMEYIDGVDFLRYVRQGGSSPIEESQRLPSATLTSRGEWPMLVEESAAVEPHFQPALTPDQLDRLRAALRQLAEAIMAAHALGKLHRDIKPQNVLVTPAGRVVLLDFGLAAELDQKGLQQSTEHHILGTVAYMAPEQAAGGQLSAASDWYSVGVMLYEALTGQRPFQGNSLQVLMDKQQFEPPPPRGLVPEVSEDLNLLCVELLRKSPEGRPSGPEVQRRLGDISTSAIPGSSGKIKTLAPFVGRTSHLETLADAFQVMRSGKAVTVSVHGQPGAGKSALVQHFLDGLAQDGAVLILAGRCYEQEMVPYKALDSLVDALTQHLRRLPGSKVKALLPRDVQSLTRVFPILERVEAVANAPVRTTVIPNPQELRRRAFDALRELLARLGDSRPLVLFIDDLQWGDVDSAGLLTDLLRPPDPPVLLLLLCFRSEDLATSPCLQALLQTRQKREADLDWRELAVGELSQSEALELATDLLGKEKPAGPAEVIARESGGNPLFVQQLVQYLEAHKGAHPDPLADGEFSLTTVVRARVRDLPEEARRLLEVVAVAGQRLSEALACKAALLGTQERRAVATLRAARLIRSTGPDQRPEIEAYHDRIRETVTAHLAAEQLEGHHRQLAQVLESADAVDPEVLASHFLAAGDLHKAGEYFARAALRAANATAFDRAAKLYRLALELGPAQEARRRLCRRQLADALANAGHWAQAAQEYLAAVPGADSIETVELQRNAAMYFLISGRMAEGLASLRTALKSVGLSLPETAPRALWSFLVRKVQLRLRGLRFHPCDESQVPALDLARLDTCLSTVSSVSELAPLYVAHFGVQSLLLALRAGERGRIVQALNMEALNLAIGRGPHHRRTQKILHMADTLAQQVGQPRVLASTILTQGMVSFLSGQWQLASQLYEKAEELFRNHCPGSVWELNIAHRYLLISLIFRGELAEMARLYADLLRDARERGNLFAVADLGIYAGPTFHLARDDPKTARQELDLIMRQWPQEGFQLPHLFIQIGLVDVDIYRGDGSAAWQRLGHFWPQFARWYLLRAQFLRTYLLFQRARCALTKAATVDAATDVAKKPLLRSAERDARRMERERVPWATALAGLLRAALAVHRGDRSAAVAILRWAVTSLEALGMHLHAAAARRRLGELLPGDEGRALIAQVDSWLSAQHIVHPARMAASAACGFPRPLPINP